LFSEYGKVRSIQLVADILAVNAEVSVLSAWKAMKPEQLLQRWTATYIAANL